MYDKLAESSRNYEKTSQFSSKIISYGTAGFRMKANQLDWIMYRMGVLASIRSIYKSLNLIGCMITASHNPVEDNGCKLIDPSGDMLEESWETYATELVNTNDLVSTVRELCGQNKLNIDFTSNRANVAVAHDTRPSCPALLEAFRQGVEAMNGNLVNYGLLSTPQLHYIVRCVNTNGEYGEANEEGYYRKLSNSLLEIWKLNLAKNSYSNYERECYIDGANGVGAIKLNLFKNYLKESSILNINIFNDSSSPDAQLNHLCGADFVKVQQKCPINLPLESINKISKYCSVDGDADRVVYYYQDGQKKFNLLDGDKISTLIASYLKELVEDAKLNDLKFGIVQTAYANGSSTDFIENKMKIEVACVPTGVKHLHHKATEYDIGVYFEANGHGTAIFSKRADDIIEDNYKTHFNNKIVDYKQINDDSYLNAIFLLKHLKDCINQTIGDAISDIIAIEIVLLSKNLTLQQWNEMYTDLPNRQLKLCVKDRSLIETYDAERRLSKPVQLQVEIDRLVSESPAKSRSFVRPSGTEDVVRIYAESITQEETDLLANKIAKSCYDLAGGVGPKP